MSQQQHFAAALLDPAQPCPPGLKTWNGSDPERRFAVYRNNVIVSLVDALADTFAVTQELVGEDFSRAMARVFAYAQPPKSRFLAFYGEDFPDFIERFPPAAGVSYLADVARLEFLRVRAYHAADVAPVPMSQFADALVDALPSLSFTLHPSVGVLESAAAVVSLWGAHQGVGHIGEVVPEVPETALIVRAGLDVEVMSIPRSSGVFIRALLRGTCFGDAVDIAGMLDPDFDPAKPLGLLIQKAAITALHSSRGTP